MSTGDVTITVLDGGSSVVVPGQNVQVVVGCSSAGTAATPVATRNPNTLASVFESGPLVESAALTCLAGGVVIAMRAATATPGAATAVVITRVGSSTSVITESGTELDDMLIKFLVVAGGTIGTAGITFKVSVDGGRNYGPVLALGTAATFAIAGTGVTLAFAAGTLEAGDKAQLSTTAPLWDSAGVAACVTALKLSPYAQSGWGSFHLVGPCTGALASTLQTAIELLATGSLIHTRLIVEARDALIPTAWGGAGETEATWIAALAADYSAVSARRILATAGHYNMPSAFPLTTAGSPRHRRPLAWALAARAVTIPPQRHAGRVRDGALANIVVDPTNDPADGFVYHDEFDSPGLESARFCTARKRKKRPGYFISQPLLMSPAGSVYTAIYLGNVMDLACDITQQVGDAEINEDVQLNDDGTIDEAAARAIEATALGQINAQMTAKKMISNATVVVDRQANVRATNDVPFAVTIFSRGYILSETVTVGYASPFAAGG